MTPPRYDVPKAAPPALRAVQEFVNTVDLEHGREWLATPADLDRWLLERSLGATAPPATAEQLSRAVALREALRALLRTNNRRPLDERAIDVLNDAASRAGIELRFGADGRPAAAVTAGSRVDAALGQLLVAVQAAMAAGSWPRLKACRNCRWAFYDYSPNRSAAWCSMTLCGNRAKTRAYRARRKPPAP